MSSSQLYSAPTLSSSLSRDPTGADPAELEKSNKLEPAGVHLESIKLARKAARMQRAAEKLKNVDVATIRAAGRLKNLDVATLVGAPPPPPKTPPPKKSHRRGRSGGSKTPQPMSGDIDFNDTGELEVENVASGMTSELDYFHGGGDNITTPSHSQSLGFPLPSGDSSFEEIKSSTTSSSTEFGIDPPTASASTAVVPSSSTSFLGAAQNHDQQHRPKTPKDISSRLSIAEQRRRTALAIYQSTDLVLDPEETLLAQQLLRPAMKTIENHAPSSSSSQNLITPTTTNTSRSISEKNNFAASGTPMTPNTPTPQKMKSFGKSPSSVSTRPHSNQTDNILDTPIGAVVENNAPTATYHQLAIGREPSPISTDEGITWEPIRDSPMSGPPPKSPGRVAAAPSPVAATASPKPERGRSSKPKQQQHDVPISPSNKKRRGFSLERRANKQPDHKEEKDKRDKKRGFFKKLFGGGNKGSKDAGSVASKDSSRGSNSEFSGSQAPSSGAEVPANWSINAAPVAVDQPRSQVHAKSDSPRFQPTNGEFPVVLSSNNPLPPPTPSAAVQPEQVVAYSASTSSNSILPATSKPALKPVLKSLDERQYQGLPLDEDFSPSEAGIGQSSSSLGMASPTIVKNFAMDQESMFSEDYDGQEGRSGMHTGSDDVSSSSSSPKIPRGVVSQDPPDDELGGGDPPVRSGRPLLSPHLTVSSSQEEAEQTRIEAVRSRLAEVYSKDHSHVEIEQSQPHIREEEKDGVITNVSSNSSDEKRDFYFDQPDEVSLLTGPSFEGSLQKKSKSFDPFHQQLASEFDSLQKRSKSFDPFLATEPESLEPEEGESMQPLDGGANNERTLGTEPFVAAPSSFNTIEPEPAHLPHLRVQVKEQQNLDPAGESPLKFNSMRGAQRSTFNDPVGESPVAWKKEMSLNDPAGDSPRHAATPGADKNEAPPPPSDDHVPSESKDPENSAWVSTDDEVYADPSVEVGAGYISDDSTSFLGVEEKKEDDNRAACNSQDVDRQVASKDNAEPKSALDGLPKAGGNSDTKWDEDESASKPESQSKVDETAPQRRLEPQSDMDEPMPLAVKLTSGYDADESGMLSEASSMVSSAVSSTVSKGNTNRTMSRAVRAALKLSRAPTGKDAIKAQLYQIPTPKNELTPSNRVGSTPLLSPTDADNDAKVEAEKVVRPPVDLVPPRHEARDRLPRAKKTEVEKAGFKSAPATPATKPKSDSLTVSTAAYTNAKAVAYLHRLHGEPSPRHLWHSAKKKKPEPSPLNSAEQRKARKEKKKKNREKNSQRVVWKAPSPSEYGAHNFSDSSPSIDVDNAIEVPEDSDATPKRAHVAQRHRPFPEVLATKKQPKAYVRRQGNNTNTAFAAYNSKFHGRKPFSKKNVPMPDAPRSSPKSPTALAGSVTIKPKKKPPPSIVIPGAISATAVKRGFMLLRMRRKDDIQSGRSTPVIPTPKAIPTGRNRFNFVPAKEEEIRDPIQRAGRRLLSKAAIPIQSAGRQYLARREAFTRMRALILIQACFRRWRCEAHLQAIIHSAKLVQTAYRGFSARELVKDMHSAATKIQKIVRGHLAAAHIYDMIYYVVRIQALMKGIYTRKMMVRRQAAAVTIQKTFRGHWSRVLQHVSKKLVFFQAAYRGFKARQEFEIAKSSVVKIQTAWRAYSARLSFQFQIVDIIIVQSIARRWSAGKKVQQLRKHKKTRAATKIQAAWRGFQSYTDYIFAIVDILVVQRTMRQWLARRKLKALKEDKEKEAEASLENKAAIVLQSQWRRIQAQKTLVYSMVHIIIVQSVARRWLIRSKMQGMQSEMGRRRKAATKIQAAWRGFWSFSHYIIVQYEVVKIQALVRGIQARQSVSLKLGCGIIIQAIGRQMLAKKRADMLVVEKTRVAAKTQELRERNASKRIQFWWRIVLDWTKEKKAALTIERFFIHVRAEVDREIRELERKEAMKKEKRRKSKRRDPDDKLLETAWSSAVDDSTICSSTPSNYSKGSRRKSAPLPKSTPTSHGNQPHKRSSLASNKFPGNGCWPPIQHTHSTTAHVNLPTDLQLNPSEDHSIVSNITNPTFLQQAPHPKATPKSMGSEEQPTLEQGVSLSSSSFKVVESRKSGGKRMTTQDYIKKYGPQAAAPNPMPTDGQKKHFFSEEKSSTPSQSHSRSSSAPRSTRNSTGGFSKVVLTPKGYAHPPSTPRSSAGNFPPATPRSAAGDSLPVTPRNTTPRNHGKHFGGAPSPRIPGGNRQNHYPPVTPNSKQKRLSNPGAITRRETAETESQTTMSQSTYTRPSPRSYQENHQRPRGNPNVMVMKSVPNYAQSFSMEEAHEMLYLGDDYGEV